MSSPGPELILRAVGDRRSTGTASVDVAAELVGEEGVVDEVSCCRWWL